MGPCSTAKELILKAPRDGDAQKTRLLSESRKERRYLQEKLFLNHLFRLADETFLQGVDLLYQLKGTGVTGLFKGNKIKQLRYHQFKALTSLCKIILFLLKCIINLQTPHREN